MNYNEICRKHELEQIVFQIREHKVEYQVDKPMDKSFKNILSIKRAFIKLVRDYVDKELMEKIEEENIELCDKEFITTDLQKREADIIYKVKNKNKEIYFILTEIQSKVDYKMAYRILEYMCEIWRKFGVSRESNTKNFKLPVIIPCVLYIGKDNWNAKMQFAELFNENVRNKKYIPQFEYVLIDINKIKDEELLEKKNLISSIFFLNKAKSGDEAVKRVEQIKEIFDNLDIDEQNSFITWVEGMFLSKEVCEIVKDNFRIKEECEMGFAEYGEEMVEIWRQRAIKKGIEQGLAQGREQGLAQGREQGLAQGREQGLAQGREQGKEQEKIRGKRETVKKLLTKKLNVELIKMQLKLIDEASFEKLDEVEDKIFEITSWDEVEEILN